MTDDLVERATRWASMLNGSHDDTDNGDGALVDELLDRIEAQAKLIDALRAGLDRIAVYSPAVTHGWAEHVRNIARALLASIKEPGV
jgi:hypothetical protein